MTAFDTQTTVAQFVTERPARARVFEQFGIDYCCGGRTPLSRACAEKGLDVATVLRGLRASDEAAPGESERDFSKASMTELADHIVETHHVYLRRELPRLASMADKVVQAHSERHPELLALRETLGLLKNELESHMLKEEQILFPMIRQLESATVLPDFHCGSVNGPIGVMEHEHDNAGDALARMRDLTGGYAPPGDACNTYRALLAGLAELEADTHRHIHKENNILFPKAVAAEAALRPGQ